MATILVVDDEPQICEMLSLILERGGFVVYSAANGVQALHKYHLYRNDIDLVIADIAMPDIDGEALASRLLAERADLPMILMSPCCDPTDDSRPNVRYLPKPFELSTLLSTVRSLLTKARVIPALVPEHNRAVSIL
jgi:two-component system OmpR family response regulator